MQKKKTRKNKNQKNKNNNKKRAACEKQSTCQKVVIYTPSIPENPVLCACGRN